MNNSMNKRVYGVVGVSSIMSNWNADFSGNPKTTTSGNIFGSDKALKFTIKKMWEASGEKVLYVRSMKMGEAGKDGSRKVIPRSLRERYEFIFRKEGIEKNAEEVLRNLFLAKDVKNFGATFAEEGMNISITGAVQFGQGMNKYEETEVQEQTILSPFRDPKAKEKSKEEKEAAATTLGTKIVSDEAHYFYPFSINPLVYNDFVEMGVTEGYTEGDYLSFKEAALASVTSYSTNSKPNCDNEFALFIETDPKAYLPTLTQYIEFEKGEKKNTIRFTNRALFEKNGIQSIELYYNPVTTTLEGFDSGEISLFDITTGERI